MCKDFLVCSEVVFMVGKGGKRIVLQINVASGAQYTVTCGCNILCGSADQCCVGSGNSHLGALTSPILKCVPLVTFQV